MKEQLISFKTAKLAKEKGLAGFKNKKWYYKDGTIHTTPKAQCWNTWEHTQGIRWTIITQALLQKWLREDKNVVVYITPRGWSEGLMAYHYNSVDRENGIKAISNPVFDTYEEALEEGLQAALELINKNYGTEKKQTKED